MRFHRSYSPVTHASEPEKTVSTYVSLTGYHNTCILSLMKPLKFVGTSHDDLCAFPAEARRAAGFELWQVQQGATPSDWKPMADVGPGVYEVRIHVLGEWRVIYVAKFAEGLCTPCFPEESTAHAPARYRVGTQALSGDRRLSHARR